MRFCLRVWGWPPTTTDAQPIGPLLDVLDEMLTEKKD